MAAKAAELLAVGDAERAAVLLELGADDGEAAELPRLELLAASARVEAARQHERVIPISLGLEHEYCTRCHQS